MGQLSGTELLLASSLLATRHISKAWLIDINSKSLKAGVNLPPQTSVCKNDPDDAPTSTMEEIMKDVARCELPSKDLLMVIDTFKSPTVLMKQRNFRWCDRSYICVRADRFSIYAREQVTKSLRFEDGINQPGGLLIGNSGKSLVTALYPPTAHAAIAVEAVEQFVAYLRTKNR
ncbi:Profilin-4 [Sparganum proliferum]